jgi:DeoR family glycerol-3-phosphate regulon repressor
MAKNERNGAWGLTFMMRNVERHSVILGLLQKSDHVSIETMAHACGASLQTIRRDLDELSRNGRVRRYHGGATLAPGAPAASYESRSVSHVPEKKAAAAMITEVVADGASLFLAGGSTLALTALRLRERNGLRIITNNLHAAVALFDRDGFDVHLTGGISRPASGSLTGEDALHAIERFSVDFAIIGTCGIAPDGALLEYDQSIVSPVLAMIGNARETVLVADSSKFGGSGIVRGAHLRQVRHLVTDRPPTGAMAELVGGYGISVHAPARTF